MVNAGINRLADRIVAQFPVEHRKHTEAPLIPNDAADVMTEITVMFIADLIQAYIDAGSERDVTYENDELRDVIQKEFDSWAVRGFEAFTKEHPEITEEESSR